MEPILNEKGSRPQTSSSNMSKYKGSVERRCVLWIHDEQYSKEDVVLNIDLFPEGIVKPGDLMAIVALKTDVAVKDFQDKNLSLKKGPDTLATSFQLDQNFEERKSSSGSANLDGPHDIDQQKRYLFSVKAMSKALKAKQPNLEVSIAKHIADVFGFKHRSNVLLTTTNTAMITASHVEISFKDEYLARSDMWRLTISEMSSKTIYKGQKIVFIGTIKAQVTAVYVGGRRVHSAFFSTTTKPIFRSESARFVLFIQMSREMWDFDSEGSGEIMFTKVVNGFLPALFKRWVKLKVRHLVSIVLFTRVEYNSGLTSEFAVGSCDPTYHTGVQTNGARKPYKDFYRVVVSEMDSGEWTTILYQLKREFRYFRHDISMHRLNNTRQPSSSVSGDGGMGSVPGTRTEAEPTLAIHGNILEAINLASSQYANDYIDRDLLRTGISIILITPGVGLFEVDYEMLRITTENLVSSGIGIDLVCLPKIPLHSVPLFRYRNLHNNAHQEEPHIKDIGSPSTTPRQGAFFGSYSSLHGSLSPSNSSVNGSRSQRTNNLAIRKHQNEWSYAIPHWLDVSFWTGASQDFRSRPWAKIKSQHPKPRNNIIHRSRDFAIRCKMFELEMSSITNDGMVEISVEPLPDQLNPPVPMENLQDKSLTNPIITHRLKKHASLTGTIFGPARSVIDKRSGQTEKIFFERLDVYDQKASILPDLSERARSRGDNRRLLKVGSDTNFKKIVCDDAEVSTRSIKENHMDPSSRNLYMSVISGKKNNSKNSLQDGNESLSTWKDSFSSLKPMASITSPDRPPKFSRQISLGLRGFGIAAPKVVAAELQIENAKAPVASENNLKRQEGSGMNPSIMETYLISSPRQETNQMRPASSQSSLRSSKLSSQNSVDMPDKPTVPSRPIAIKSIYHPTELQDQSKARTILGSVYEGADANEVAEQLETLKKLKSSDTLKESKSKLMANSTAILPATLSPTTALSPWLTILNPSNPTVDDNNTSQYKRWQHVFPRPLQTKAMKWKSLCSPASVPLTTEYFPTQEQLNIEYHQKPYNVSQDLDEDLDELPKNRDEFLRELISLRLSQGFQIVVGPAVAEAFGQRVMKIGDPFDHELLAKDGGSVFMSMGNTFHQLSCINGTEVEVNRFLRKTMTLGDDHNNALRTYKPAVRTTLANDYELREIMLATPKDEYNWNFVDSFIAGQNEEMTESLRFWRARFVLIPVEQFSSNHRRRGEDNEEETRLEGIKALTQIWQRHRYILPSEKQFRNHQPRKIKDPNPLDIVYQTQDPSVIINAELEILTLPDSGEPHPRRGRLLLGAEPFRKANLNITALAEAIQAPIEKGGVRMQNRRWHFRLHYNCFIGSDMTTWLLENFEDIETREEAEELGNMLMCKEDERKAREKEPNEKVTVDKERERDMGIFVHVEKRHPFRDGQYFYQMADEHAKPRPETRGAWPFGSRRRDTSMPSTPMTENVTRDSPKPDRILSSSSMEDKTCNSGTTTPTNTGVRKPRVALSKVMKYDVDPRKRSYRPERINLHYDWLHNPDNCYHIRIDWMNVTAKLIEDAIQSWAITADRYGLRLIEVPIGEASSITDVHPFRSPYLVQLASSPPDQQPPTYFDATSLAPQISTTRHYYQKAIMRKHNFVLDVEAAENFPANVEVVYSWGRPDYKYTQYIHRSGVLLAQVTDDGNFLLLTNKLYNNRTVAASREQEKFKKLEHIDRGNSRMSTIMGHGPSQTTPKSSPILRAYIGSPIVQAISADVLGPPRVASKAATFMTAEVIAQELIDFCSNASLLEEFYKEVLEKSTPPAATPPVFQRQQNHHAVLEQNIPTLGLPPGLFQRESSPSPMRLGNVPLRRGTQRSETGSISSHDSPKGNTSSDG